MKFMTVRDLRSNTAAIRKNLAREREIVLTANGKPFAVMTPVDSDSVEEEIVAMRRVRAQAAISRIRAKARRDSLDGLTTAKIDALIAKARRERRSAK
jgi:antitoxin (DNA-binding transcriptional repressor) of toxin-antitoxin stability system